MSKELIQMVKVGRIYMPLVIKREDEIYDKNQGIYSEIKKGTLLDKRV